LKVENRKIETFQLRMTSLEKETLTKYTETKGIKNKSKWILELIEEKIKLDKEIGILELKKEIDFNKNEQIKLSL